MSLEGPYITATESLPTTNASSHILRLFQPYATVGMQDADHTLDPMLLRTVDLTASLVL